MASEIEIINGVTKTRVGDTGVYFYEFPVALIKIDINKNAYEIRTLKNFAEPITAKYDQISNKLGSSDIESYVDELARQRFFFDLQELARIEELEKYSPYGSLVKTSFESSVRSELKSQTELLKDIRNLLKAIAE